MVVSFPKLMIAGSAIGAIVGGSVLLKDFIVGKGQRLPATVRADGKVCIVTGANTGIGYETSKELARKGCKVYMACRNMEKCIKARAEIISDTMNKEVYCKHCDLADFESVRDFAESFKRREDRLDILINNAGIMRCPRMLTKQGIEMQLGVNHMGHFLLTNLLLDTMKNSVPSRIVNVSSIAHTRGAINFEDLNSEKSYDPGTAYNQSKLANVLFTKELAETLKGTGVTANVLHPGIVKTEITRYMGFEDSIIASVFVKPILSFFLKSPAQGALTSIHVALEPSLETVSGKYYSDCKETEPSAQAQDSQTAKRLWATSEKWTRTRLIVITSNNSESQARIEF